MDAICSLLILLNHSDILPNASNNPLIRNEKLGENKWQLGLCSSVLPT